MKRNWLLLGASILVAAMACATESRLVPVITLPDNASTADLVGSMVVPYPPPPAKVETVPPAPVDRACFYWDGQWTFGARDWEWIAGTWVIPPPGCAFARSRIFWQTAGADRSELRFRRGRWVKTDQVSIDCPIAQPCPGSSAALTP